MTHIVIRHTNGSKANQVEEFSLEQLEDMIIGRDPQAGIRFDPDKDDLVSRRHGRIIREPGERLAFRIVDLNSSNGLFINGARVMGESALLPGDEIHLGLDGPRFVFDVEPRPDYMVARTRVFIAGAPGAAGGIKVTTMSPFAQPNTRRGQKGLIPLETIGRQQRSCRRRQPPDPAGQLCRAGRSGTRAWDPPCSGHSHSPRSGPSTSTPLSRSISR
jgi:predicted component of type VI protein secretion system